MLPTNPATPPPTHYLILVTGSLRSFFYTAGSKQPKKTLLFEHFAAGQVFTRQQNALAQIKDFCFKIQSFEEAKTQIKIWEYTPERLAKIQASRKTPIKLIGAKPKVEPTPPTPNEPTAQTA